MVALRIHDRREGEMPNVGMAQFQDPETGETRWVNTASRKVREAYRQAALDREMRAANALRRAGIDTAAIATDESYIQPLRNLFSKRS
jgi:uncharacterized protein (DUF58 family)